MIIAMINTGPNIKIQSLRWARDPVFWSYHGPESFYLNNPKLNNLFYLFYFMKSACTAHPTQKYLMSHHLLHMDKKRNYSQYTIKKYIFFLA